MSRIISLEHKDDIGGLSLRHAGKAPTLINSVMVSNGALYLTSASSQLFQHDAGTGTWRSTNKFTKPTLGFALDGLVAHHGWLWSATGTSGIFAIDPATAQVAFQQKMPRQCDLSDVRRVGPLLCMMQHDGKITPLAFNLTTRTLHQFAVASMSQDTTQPRRAQGVVLLPCGYGYCHFPHRS